MVEETDEMRRVKIKELVSEWIKGKSEKKFIECYGKWNCEIEEGSTLEEANYLGFGISKTQMELNWYPCYDFNTTIQRTVNGLRSIIISLRVLRLPQLKQIETNLSGVNNE
ncbi:MAG: hypothetical protein ACYCSO_06930 [Cuniculiplasma sp.]